MILLADQKKQIIFNIILTHSKTIKAFSKELQKFLSKGKENNFFVKEGNRETEFLYLNRFSKVRDSRRKKQRSHHHFIPS